MENAVVETPSIPLKMGHKYIPAGFEMSISYYTDYTHEVSMWLMVIPSYGR